MDQLTLAVRLVLFAVFAAAGIAKLRDRAGARQAVAGFGVPATLVGSFAAVLPVTELLVAVALLVSATAVAGAVAAEVLLGAFIAGIVASLARGRRPDCRCFGQLHSAPVGGRTLTRNVAMAAAAGLVVFRGPGTGIGSWASGLTGLGWAALVAAIALTVAFVIEGSLLLSAWRRRGAGGTTQGSGPIPATPIPPSRAALSTEAAFPDPRGSRTDPGPGATAPE
jgi:uncharacterized membrane protein YphA (DoxX/SURF4 family)